MPGYMSPRHRMKNPLIRPIARVFAPVTGIAMMAIPFQVDTTRVGRIGVVMILVRDGVMGVVMGVVEATRRDVPVFIVGMESLFYSHCDTS